MTGDARQEILRAARTIAVVGLSPKPERPSHQVAQYLRRAGYRIVPVNPGHAVILGERSYPSGAVVDEAIRVRPRPRLIWLQQGVVDDEAAERAAAAGIPFVMDRCIMVDHQLLEV